MLAPINSEKHYVQFAQALVTASTTANLIVVEAVAVVDKDFTSEVEQGSIIKAVYIEMWASTNSGGINFGTMTVEKLSGGQPSQTNTNSNNLNVYLNKKNILFTFEGLYPPNNTNPVPIIRQWILIPKGKQRFGLGDKLELSISTGGTALTRCGFMTYKEYK